ncbi:uncharacterized protein BT62DRAFT_1057901 [Guyanagaster necrorhizus]|uniref:Uncharacterized protein n=1 Tax=Guyanagaster necrorhizus TaxID=856835 RepID=A0A9P7VEI3_9AGAR|nr:uncharacterized protein BT62DRAFT_1057901 [Guyanagaster necrorhizus MCA 3950]KAG7439453.1 hypothetical protein BT62DRAFT_1057901 [Guyanagaster necrorhizus MCA 3950]
MEFSTSKSLGSPSVSLLPRGLPADTPVSIRSCRCGLNYPNGCEWHIFHPGGKVLVIHHKKSSEEPAEAQRSPPNSPSNLTSVSLTEGQLNSFGFGYHKDATFTLTQNLSKQTDLDPWVQVLKDGRNQCLGCDVDIDPRYWTEHREVCRGIEMRVVDVIADAWEKEAKNGSFASRALGIFSLLVIIRTEIIFYLRNVHRRPYWGSTVPTKSDIDTREKRSAQEKVKSLGFRKPAYERKLKKLPDPFLGLNSGPGTNHTLAFHPSSILISLILSSITSYYMIMKK